MGVEQIAQWVKELSEMTIGQLAGVIAGFLIAWLIFHRKIKRLQERVGHLFQAQKALDESEDSGREILKACSTLFERLGMAVTVPVVTCIGDDGRMVRFEGPAEFARCVAHLKRKCKQSGLPTGPPDGPGDEEDWDDEAE